MPAVRLVDRRSATERRQVYLEALALANDPRTPPGTVCVQERHYQRGRHPVPYRMGYCHHYKEPTVHYHTTYQELQRCPA